MAASVDWAPVVEAIGSAEQAGRTLGVAAIAPSGARFGHNADRRFRAASTVKIPIMIELFRQIDAGELAAAHRHVLRAEDRAPGSGVMLHLHEGMEFTLDDLIYLMISVSDNTATNILIDLAGMERVNATMRRLGMNNSTLGRKMQGHAASLASQENWASPNDYAAVVAALLAGRAGSADACARMVAFLEKQQNDRRIARHLPRTDRPRWGSKTGSIPGVTNDVGFIETPRGMLVVSAFCEHQDDPHGGEQAIGDVSRAALQAVG